MFSPLAAERHTMHSNIAKCELSFIGLTLSYIHLKLLNLLECHTI